MTLGIQKRIYELIADPYEPEPEPVLEYQGLNVSLTESVDYLTHYMKTVGDTFVIPVSKYPELYETLKLTYKSSSILIEGLEYRDPAGDVWNIFLLEDGPHYGANEPMVQITPSWSNDIPYYKTALTKKVVKGLFENSETRIAPIVTMAAMVLMVSWMISKDLFANTSIFSEEVIVKENIKPDAIILPVENVNRLSQAMDRYVNSVYELDNPGDYSIKIYDLSYRNQNNQAQDVFISTNGVLACGIDKPQYKIVPKTVNGEQYYMFEKN